MNNRPCHDPRRSLRGAVGVMLLAGMLIPMLIACAHAPTIRDRRVIVLEFENSIQDESAQPLSRALAELVTAELVNQPRVAIIDRGRITSLEAFNRQQRQRTGWIRKPPQPDYLIVGAISRLNHNYIINTRIFSVSLGEFIKGSTLSKFCDREEDLYPVMQAMTQGLAFHLNILAERHDALAMSNP